MLTEVHTYCRTGQIRIRPAPALAAVKVVPADAAPFVNPSEAFAVVTVRTAAPSCGMTGFSRVNASGILPGQVTNSRAGHRCVY